MKIDLEKKVKILAVFILLLFLIDFIYFNIFLSIDILVIFSSIFFIIIFEVYIRVQHNIDDKFNNISNKFNVIDDKFLSLEEKFEKANITNQQNLKQETNKLLDINSYIDKSKVEIMDKIFLTRKELEAMILNFKYDFNKVEYSTNHLVKSLLKIYVKEGQKESLLKIAPDVFKYKSVLYIGASIERSLFLEEFIKANYQITILEIFEKNVDFYKNQKNIKEVLQGDVINYDFKEKFDVVFWWHGPEHIDANCLSETVKKLESIANNIVVMGCPYGRHEHGEIYGNIYEKHLSSYNEGYFEDLGYTVDYFGRRDIVCSNICAAKYIKNNIYDSSAS